MIIRSSTRVLAWPLLLLAVVGCSSSSNTTDDKIECVTALRLNLEIADGTTINQVEYKIEGNGMPAMGGIIDTSAPGATASVEQYGIPPGSGYLVTMVATSTDGMTMCGGSATFDVDAGISTEVDVILHCKGTERFGGVRVNGELNVCAELDKVIVAPLQTASGFALEVSALGSDEEEDDVEYRWTATGGAFDDSSASDTVFTCDAASPEELTIEISDDGFEYCFDSWVVPVNCVDEDGAGGSGGDSGGGTGGNGGGGIAGGGGDGSGGAGGMTGTGGTGGGTGGAAGGGTGGTGGGTGGTGGTGGGYGGDGGHGYGGYGGDSGGDGGTNGGTGGSGTGGNGAGGTAGDQGAGGGIPPECLVTVTVD